jgi:hypothetical protein
MNILAVVANFQHAALEALAATLFADEFHVREKLHLNGDGAIALTGFAAATGHVEGEMASGKTSALSVGRICKDIADGVEGL